MNARLRALYDHKYVDRPKAQYAIFAYADKRPLVYALGNKGASCLSTRYGLKMPSKVYWTEKNRRVREKHIEHTLGISDFMVGIEMMCQERPELELIDPDAILANAPPQTRKARYPFRWKTRVWHDGRTHDISIVPDFVFGLRNTKTEKEKFFFLEIDNATMPVSRKDVMQTSFMRKVQSYIDTLDQDTPKRRFSIPGFQVLTVTTSEKRIASIQKAIARVSEHNFSANTFLFKSKENLQTTLPFHGGWQNIKGNNSKFTF